MADVERIIVTATATATVSSSSQLVPTTRLRNRAPASIEIKRPALSFNVAIPLLSPLVSPSSCGCGNSVQEAELTGVNNNKGIREDGNLGQSFIKWQHPAAPFYYGSVPRAPFVPV